MVQEKIKDADTPTIRLCATPSGLISDPPPSFPIFMLDALPAATVPLYPGLGQASHMLACIPSGMVVDQHHTTTVLWTFFRDQPGEPVPQENF